MCFKLLVEAGADLEARDDLWLVAAAQRGLVVQGPGDGGNVETDVAVIAATAPAWSPRDNSYVINLIYWAIPRYFTRPHLVPPPAMVSLLLNAGAAVNALDPIWDWERNTRPQRHWTWHSIMVAAPPCQSSALRAGGVLNQYQRSSGWTGTREESNSPLPLPCARGKGPAEYYLAKVDAGGGFKKYEQAHLATGHENIRNRSSRCSRPDPRLARRQRHGSTRGSTKHT